jgi:hypothetical protein
MIEIGNKSKILLKNSGIYALSELVDFYDIIGMNVLYIHHQNDHALKCNNIRVEPKYTWETLKSKIVQNLFRLHIIIVSENKFSHKIEQLIDSEIHLPTIYTTRKQETFKLNFEHSKNRYDNWYTFFKEDSTYNFSAMPDFTTKLIIENNVQNWQIYMSDLKTKYIRNKKIENLFE